MTRRLLVLLGFGLTALAAGPPSRIVSTAPSITEMLYALGLGDKVVGVTRYCRYPAEAMQKPKLGDYINPNLEAITALRPDLVILQTNPVQLGPRLNRLHLNTLEISHENIEGIFTSIRKVGDATGTSAKAAQLVASIRTQLDQVRARSAGLPKVPMMFVIGRAPNRLEGMVVVGQASYLNEIIALAGGENVFKDAAAAYPKVSLEDVMARNPAVILDMGDMSDTVNVTPEHMRSVVALWQRMNSLSAVRNGRVLAVASDIYVVPGPRVTEAARAIFTALHPEKR